MIADLDKEFTESHPDRRYWCRGALFGETEAFRRSCPPDPGMTPVVAVMVTEGCGIIRRLLWTWGEAPLLDSTDEDEARYIALHAEDGIDWMFFARYRNRELNCRLATASEITYLSIMGRDTAPWQQLLTLERPCGQKRYARVPRQYFGVRTFELPRSERVCVGLWNSPAAIIPVITGKHRYSIRGSEQNDLHASIPGPLDI